MLRTFRSRRRNQYGAQICALASALLLLLSVSLLYSRLTPDQHHGPHHRRATTSTATDSGIDDPFTAEDPLLEDSDPRTALSNEDRIDELDVVDDDDSKVSDEEEILRGLDSEGEDIGQSSSRVSSASSGFFFDHVATVIRRAFDRRSIDEIDRWDYQGSVFDAGVAYKEDRSKVGVFFF